MLPVISASQMRDIDRQTTDKFAVPSLTLMENAAAATARAASDLCSGDVTACSILVICGKGNNGGDGAAAARLLATAGARVQVVLLGKVNETSGDARTNFDRLQHWKEDRALRQARPFATTESGELTVFECESEKGWQQLLDSVLAAPHDVIIDAVFGTGLTRPVAGIHQQAVRYINEVRARGSESAKNLVVLSVDLPSGLNADSERLIGETVSADATVTMTAPKRSNVIPPAPHHNGKLIVADTGSP